MLCLVFTPLDDTLAITVASDTLGLDRPQALSMHGGQQQQGSVAGEENSSYFSDTPLIILFLPYILLILVIIVLMVLSFVRFHRTHGHVYRGRLDKARRMDMRRNLPQLRGPTGDVVASAHSDQDESESDVINDDYNCPSSLGGDGVVMTNAVTSRRQFESSHDDEPTLTFDGYLAARRQTPPTTKMLKRSASSTAAGGGGATAHGPPVVVKRPFTILDRLRHGDTKQHSAAFTTDCNGSMINLRCANTLPTFAASSQLPQTRSVDDCLKEELMSSRGQQQQLLQQRQLSLGREDKRALLQRGHKQDSRDEHQDRSVILASRNLPNERTRPSPLEEYKTFCRDDSGRSNRDGRGHGRRNEKFSDGEEKKLQTGRGKLEIKSNSVSDAVEMVERVNRRPRDVFEIRRNLDDGQSEEDEERGHGGRQQLIEAMQHRQSENKQIRPLNSRTDAPPFVMRNGEMERFPRNRPMNINSRDSEENSPVDPTPRTLHRGHFESATGHVDLVDPVTGRHERYREVLVAPARDYQRVREQENVMSRERTASEDMLREKTLRDEASRSDASIIDKYHAKHYTSGERANDKSRDKEPLHMAARHET